MAHFVSIFQGKWLTLIYMYIYIYMLHILENQEKLRKLTRMPVLRKNINLLSVINMSLFKELTLVLVVD